MCVCVVVGWFRFWLDLLPNSLEVGMLISSRPTGCVCVCFDELLLLFLLFQLVMMTRWFFVLWVEGDQAVVFLILAVIVVVFVVFSIVDVTRLLAVRHKLIHAHTSSTRTQGRTHTHSRTHKRLECACVIDSSFCVWAAIFIFFLFQDTL